MGSGQFSSIGSGTSLPSSAEFFRIWSALPARPRYYEGSSPGPLTDVRISALHGFPFYCSSPTFPGRPPSRLGMCALPPPPLLSSPYS